MMSKAELLYASKVTVAFTSLVAVTEHNTVLTVMKTLHYADDIARGSGSTSNSAEMMFKTSKSHK